MSTGKFFVVLIAGAGLAPSPLNAQLQFTPTVGFYLPFGGAVMQESDALGRSTLKKVHVAAAALSGRLTYWTGPRFGLELAGTFSPGLVAVHDAMSDPRVQDIPAALWLASARGLVYLVPEKGHLMAFYVGTGFGLADRGGEAWSDTPAGPTPAVVMSFGTSGSLGRRAKARLRLELEDYFTWNQFDAGDPVAARGKFHHNLILSLGISIPVMGR